MFRSDNTGTKDFGGEIFCLGDFGEGGGGGLTIEETGNGAFVGNEIFCLGDF